ncbi:DapH/DapD/GlmU-related protein [Phyllobacterium calauticae]|jgi:phosphonate metabolism protein (transferase hexapeptide repeat family)|uniref:DapH/DapD/GlmU-related protein n=1 Tax=Phyllobacterium calauticae TaxID=2817027 RepID=UPI001CBC46E3|nr:DapH/DapD/GlmU-related protein [Phyllobacterium calauticae]MBZ3692519.1 antibiotic acetyltransferase [Phyllobacterium calauticae]
MADPDDLRFQNPEPRIHPTAQLKGVKLGRFAEVSERVILRDVTMGDFSYIERHSEGIYADIGRFCSIASNTRINALEHPMERLTTHKVSYRPNEFFRYQGVDFGFRARRQAKRVSIGHDVWIGHGAVIMPGISIGHGAVIGANAVVTKNVAPYTIVAGNPARLIRPRFPAAIAERLMALAWWDWPATTIFEAIPDIQSLGIEDFLAKWER